VIQEREGEGGREEGRKEGTGEKEGTGKRRGKRSKGRRSRSNRRSMRSRRGRRSRRSRRSMRNSRWSRVPSSLREGSLAKAKEAKKAARQMAPTTEEEKRKPCNRLNPRPQEQHPPDARACL